ncbi:hypothetical protein BpHYR1_035089 [Brachionus plicatilis]|uniref:Uncharacterized protein n=1 Tax=Brachionus plicatilis TaxID=10195 RepID=A0A3M7SZD7_BRAPC|nr:hypothetical protein BpHYR1_035089 [Brachionus plicatilis]
MIKNVLKILKFIPKSYFGLAENYRIKNEKNIVYQSNQNGSYRFKLSYSSKRQKGKKKPFISDR